MASVEALLWLGSYLLLGAVVAWLQQGTGPSIWYPPIAVGVAFLIRGGVRCWPLVLLADFAVSFPQYGQQVPDALIVASNTTLECVLAAWFLGQPHVIAGSSTSRDFALKLGLLALLSTGVGAGMGTLLLASWGHTSQPMLTVWLSWWLGDATTLLTLLPAVFLTFVRARNPSAIVRRSWIESAALLGFTLLVGLSRLLTGPDAFSLVFSGLMLGTIPVLWAAIRYDLRTTAWVVVLVSVGSILGMRLHAASGTVTPAGFEPQLLVLQGNLVVLALAGFTLAPVLAAERRARMDLQRLAGDLRLQVTHTRMAQRAGRTGSWECDPNGDHALWSDELYELFRLDKAQGPPSFERLRELTHPDSRWVMDEARRAALEGRVNDVFQVQVCWPDGGTAWHAVRWEAVSVGGQRRIVGTHTDVTDLMQRRLAAEHLAAVVSTAAEAILTVDREFRICTWNPAAERLFGMSSSEATGHTIHDLVPAARKRHKERRLAAAFEGEPAEAPHAEMQTISGDLLHVRMSFSPVRDASGRIVEVAVVCSDLTRQRELEEQLLQSQKMEVVGRLAGGIAHDFNNMLTAILGFSQLVRTQVAHDSPAARSVEQVVQAAERASSLTQRLLAFSRRQPRMAQVLDLDAELARMMPLFRRLLGEDLDLELRSGALGAAVLLDPTQLEQVMLNLVINARDAMPEGGRITIDTRVVRSGHFVHPEFGGPPGARVQLSVRDTGTGMDDATRRRIFEPFFTTKELGRGTGLGLSTVLAIVRESQGAIHVASTPGQGTCFDIDFPEAAPERAVPPLAPPPRVLASASGERVLVVEDEPLVSEFLVACLRSARYEVQLAPSAEHALELLSDHRVSFDLLVTDIVLPRMTGIELARMAREVVADLPVLFLSGYSEAMFDRLPGELLCKPFTREDLLTAVRRTLERDGIPTGG
ncbi:MAG: PAS domain S-box protein [Candidatus Eisenbacteria bacterium]